jgi:peptidoglycan-associated lipoprotein
MKPVTIVNLLLITAMLTAMGCATNDVVKKDEGLIPSAPQKNVDTRKEIPVKSADTASATAANARQDDRQIVPADNQKSPVQQTAPSSVVYFGFDSYVLTTESGNTLQSNYNKLASRPTIQIEGHCDEQGSSEYNLSLGEKRAKAAQNYLVTLGYPSARISTISFGKERPASPGHDEDSWAKNRRDELKIVR